MTYRSRSSRCYSPPVAVGYLCYSSIRNRRIRAVFFGTGRGDGAQLVFFSTPITASVYAWRT